MDTTQTQQLKPPRSIRFRRSISSLMDHGRPTSPAHSTTSIASRSPSTSPTRPAAPAPAPAPAHQSASPSSTSILFVPAASSRPRAKSAQSFYRDAGSQQYLYSSDPAWNVRPHSRDSSPHRLAAGRDREHLFSAVPPPMSYEVPPARPMPPASQVLSCYPSTSNLRFRQALPAEINKKPLPPLPGRSATPAPVPSIRVEESNAPRTSTSTPGSSDMPAELPVPGLHLDTEPSRPPAELETPEPEYHVHATSRPDCAICAQQDEFWGFGLGVGMDFPLTPPDTPGSPEAGHERAELRWDTLKKIPQQGRDITSWLALSPPISIDSGASGEDAFFQDEMEPESAVEEYGGPGHLARLEQELRANEAQAGLAPQQKRARTRTPRTLLSLPSALLASVFRSLESHADVYSLAATHSHLHDVLACYKLEILISATPKPLATLLAASSSNPSSSFARSPSSSGTSIYESIPSYAAAIRYHTAICRRVKSLIRTHCRFFLSKHLLTPSSPGDEVAFDAALHHLWAFSLLFNSSKRHSTSSDDVSVQSHWLRQLKFSMQQLKDILEVYQCIGVLLCPLTEDLRAAVQAGVIDVLPVRADMETALEMWVMQLQTVELGKIVRVLEMADERFSGEERWSEVESSGLASVRAGENRRMWLKCAVGDVYKELQDLERRSIVPRKGVWGQTISYMSDAN